MIENKLPQSITSVAQEFQPLYDLSMVIPTRNEAGNIEPLLMRIHQALKGISAEVVFVDDSTDGTPDVIRKLQEWFPLPIKLIHRPQEARQNGLGGAVVEGFKATQGTWMGVMDADLQHPPEMIPRLLRHAQKSGSDIVVGSRLAPGGDSSSLGLTGNLISHVFAWTTRIGCPQRRWNVTDPLTGFYLTRRAALKVDELQPDGFKILLEILVSHPQLKVSEVAIQFGHRNAGESKASVQETIKFFRGLYRLRMAGNANFMKFLLVGLTGLVVNSAALYAFTELAGINYIISAAIATQVSTLWNFGLTETWVFGKRQTERPFLQRLVSFLLINNLLLILRGPIITWMVGRLGVHYLISNLVSLFVMTLLRYLLADKWIWNHEDKKTTITPTEERKETTMNNLTRKAEAFGYSYNIHNIIQVASMFELPELEYFRVPALTADPDIKVRVERRRKERRKERIRKSQTGIQSQHRSGSE